MKTLLEVLRASQRYLCDRQVPEPRREAEQLLMRVLEKSRLDLYCAADVPLEETELQKLRVALERRGRREPLAYILGEVEFSGLVLKVDSRVLIPRFETELLVEHVIRAAQALGPRGDGMPRRLLDLCTGSGCIALAIKKALPNWEVCASDLSTDALSVARANGQRLGLDVQWRQGNLAEPWLGEAPFDLLVSNPPYVSESWRDRLEPEVGQEPELALFAGDEGMDVLEKLAVMTPRLVGRGGQIWLEIGFDQGEKITKTFASLGSGTLLQDLEMRDRFFRLEVEGP
jgi:release factor glutamine methyltransferase